MPSTDIRIETATGRDVPLILSLIKALADYEHLSHDVVASDASVREMLASDEPRTHVLIAYFGDEPAGFALWFHNYSTFLGRRGLYLEDLFVLPQWRGRDIGHRLLAELGRIAVARDCGRMEWSVLNWNEPAIRFYRGLGARPLDGWTVYRLTGDALKNLAAAP